MPDPSITRLDYGNALQAGAAPLSPPGSISIDAFGLAQAQLVYTIDSSNANLTDAIDMFSMGVSYPYNLGFEMTSYKYAISLQPGGISTLTVDYMGVARGNGITDCQISGVSNTTAQPIETHPNFTIVTDGTIGDGSTTQILGGPPAAPSTNPNKPIFIPSGDPIAPWRFDGFGLPSDGSRNKKAGIRHYLRPMYSVRGVVFFNSQQGFRSSIMTTGVGRTLKNENDMFKLITPNDVIGALSPDICLLTAANAECIGTPDNYAGIKVVYDIMIGGDLGWDSDIYGPMAQTIF
jgi:hypothetical protein